MGHGGPPRETCGLRRPYPPSAVTASMRWAAGEHCPGAMYAYSHSMHARRRFLSLMLGSCSVVFLLAGCVRGPVRYEDDVSLHRDRSGDHWTLRWSTLARRGINLVDSSGNTGSATVSWRCRLTQADPKVWTV